MKLTKQDHDFCLRACADVRATEDEKHFLGYMAGMWAANEPVTKDEYYLVQRLTGGFLSTTTPIFNR